MSTAKMRPSKRERQARKVVRDRVRAWWAAVLVGQTAEAHPVFGDDVRAHLADNVLVITGKAASEHDKRTIEREAARFKGAGIAVVRNELVVAPVSTDRRGLLVQMLIAYYAEPQQASFAVGFLQGNTLMRPQVLTVIGGAQAAAEHGVSGLAALRTVLPRAYWDECERQLNDGKTLVLVVVDEVDAFKARALLEEETPSQRLLILPPEPADTLHLASGALKPASPPPRRKRARKPETTSRDD